MRTIPFVLCAAAIVAACVLSGCGRDSARKPLTPKTVSRAELLDDLSDCVFALGNEPIALRKAWPKQGYNSVIIGTRGYVVFASVEYVMHNGTATPARVIVASERGAYRVLPDGSCASPSGTPEARCALLTKGEWKQNLFTPVSTIAATSGLVPELPLSLE